MIQRLCCGVILMIGLALSGVDARAQVVDIDSSTSQLALAPHLAIHEDATAAETIEQVQDADFAPLGERKPNFGFSHSAYWAKFTLRNAGDQRVDLILRQDYPLIDHLDFYELDEQGVVRTLATGDRTVFSTREIQHREFLFKLDLPPRSERTYYLRFASDGPINIGLGIFAPTELVSRLSLEQLAFGVYYGGFIVLFFYNLSIFLVVRDRTFFYYLAYVACYGLYFSVHNGLSFQILWPNSPNWGNQALLLLLSLTLVFGMQFTRSILSIRRYAPILDRIGLTIQIIAGTILVASLFLPYRYLIVPTSYLTIGLVLIAVWMGVIALVRGHPPARYFMMGWLALLIGVLIYMFKTFGLLPHNIFTQNAFQAGALIEMVLLSLALASRVNEFQRDSLTDALTVLPNRRLFERNLEREFARMKQRHGPLSLAVIDIDHFKSYNDSHGHRAGDRVLYLVGRALRSGVPSEGMVARYGGEEFVALLPREDATSAARIADTMRKKVQSTKIEKGSVTVSIGIATQDDQTRFDSAEALFRAADQALYRAKNSGRNRVVSHRLMQVAES